ncbi:Ankyrin repeat [Musa troglodytarum]|uniref:Ankyrin repeat n=1 Tax=Musa troglodytarum TaxID=320322 RepID=A0A9E7JFJ1_9LILI|nr:Ankyrin repeat [Musa troglodytarum]
METPERHRGGRTDSRRGAANLPFSTPPRGTGTSPRSSRSATLIPSPSILEIAIPGHRVGLVCPLWEARTGKIDPFWQLGGVGGGSHLIEYLVRKGASVTAMTKAGQTPIDRVSTDEVRALLVECKQPLTKDDKSTTIMEVGDSVSKEHIKENNGGSVAEEAANVDEEGVDTKEKRRGEAAADEDSSKPRKAKVSLEWYGRMESRRIMFSFDVVGPSKCMFHRYRSMASSSQFLMISKPCLNVKGSSGEMLGGSQNPNAGVGNQLLESGSALAETSDAVMVRNESMLPTV